MKKLLSCVGLSLLFLLSLSVPTYALVKSDDVIIIREDEVINDDFFAAGEEVTIEGVINGDVYVGSNRLSISGTVNGDVIAGAQTIEVTGLVRDDLRVVGNNISLVGAEIGDSVSVAGNELSINKDSKVGGGLIFGGRSLIVEGSVGRGITNGSESIRVNSEVGNTVRVATTNLTIDQDAIINGNLEYKSDKEAVIEGEVRGEVIKSEGGGVNLDTESVARSFVVGFTAWAFLGAAIVGAVMVFMMPQLFRNANQKFKKNPGRTVGIGALATLATLPAIVLLMVSVFGIPLAIVTLVLWMLGIYFTKFFVAFSAGSMVLSWIGQKQNNGSVQTYLALIVGLILYYALRLLPGVGVFIRFGTVVIGFGMMLSLYIKKKNKKEIMSRS